MRRGMATAITPQRSIPTAMRGRMSEAEASSGTGHCKTKRYRHTVGVSAVRDLAGTMDHERANKGILVTTSGYGPDAFCFASGKPIELIDGGNLLYLLEQVGVKARIIMPEEG